MPTHNLTHAHAHTHVQLRDLLITLFRNVNHYDTYTFTHKYPIHMRFHKFPDAYRRNPLLEFGHKSVSITTITVATTAVAVYMYARANRVKIKILFPQRLSSINQKYEVKKKLIRKMLRFYDCYIIVAYKAEHCSGINQSNDENVARCNRAGKKLKIIFIHVYGCIKERKS